MNLSCLGLFLKKHCSRLILIGFLWGCADNHRLLEPENNSKGNPSAEETSGTGGSTGNQVPPPNGSPQLLSEQNISVCTQSELSNIRNDLSAHYVQVCDIYLMGDWNSLSPNEASKPGFSGVFNGNGKTILNLTLPNGGGLFGKVEDSGKVMNVTLNNVNISSLTSSTGSLVSLNYGTLENCHVNGGTLNVLANYYAGALVGNNFGLIKGSSATLPIIMKPVAQSVGGITGQNKGVIDSTSFTGSITSEVDPLLPLAGVTNVGGLVGAQYSPGSITNSFVSAMIDAKTNSSWVGGVGGSVGAGSRITNSSFNGNVSGTVGVGGCVGFYLGASATIPNDIQCSFKGLVNDSNTGNIIGHHN